MTPMTRKAPYFLAASPRAAVVSEGTPTLFSKYLRKSFLPSGERLPTTAPKVRPLG